MNFNYHNPVQIRFGVNFLKAIALLKENKILLVSSQGFSKRGVTQKVREILGGKCVGVIDSISPNPQLAFLQGLSEHLPEFECIIALGGGSVIDSVKFLSTNGAIMKNQALKPKSKTAKPIYAIPTTAGTSSELTQWATVWDSTTMTKHSLSEPFLYPKIAFYDAKLTLSLPRQTTIFTALDALSHAFESVWNNNANPISTHYALKAIDIILSDLLPLSENLRSLKLRENIMLASIYAGLAFSNTQTALAHALSYPLTMSFAVPHGLACSFSLPLLLECLPKSSNAYELLSPFKARLLALFERLKIHANIEKLGLNAEFIDEIFATLNERARNGIFDLKLVKGKLKETLLFQ